MLSENLPYGFVSSQVQVALSWMREREAIRKAKEAGLPKPWTQVPLLQNFRWTNVCRRDDLVTKQLYTQFYREDLPTTQLVAAALGRLINWPESLLESTGGEPFTLSHLDTMGDILHERANRSLKCFGGAYIIPPGPPGISKIDTVLLTVERVRQSAFDIYADTKRATWANLMKIDGLGSFLAGQIVCDLVDLSAGRDWPDRATFAPVGPGSARGINYMKGRPRNGAVSQLQFDREIAELEMVLRPEVPEIFDDRQLTASDLQSCMCEVSKWLSTLEGGRLKARYPGSAQPQSALF